MPVIRAFEKWRHRLSNKTKQKPKEGRGKWRLQVLCFDNSEIFRETEAEEELERLATDPVDMSLQGTKGWIDYKWEVAISTFQTSIVLCSAPQSFHLLKQVEGRPCGLTKPGSASGKPESTVPSQSPHVQKGCKYPSGAHPRERKRLDQAPHFTVQGTSSVQALLRSPS